MWDSLQRIIYYPSRVLSRKILRGSRIFISVSLSLSLARQLASNLKMLRAFPRVAYDFNDKIYGRPASHSRIYLAFRERATRPFYFRLPLAIHFLMYAPDEREGGREGEAVERGWCDRGTVWKKRRRVRYFSDVIFISPVIPFFFFQPTRYVRARRAWYRGIRINSLHGIKAHLWRRCPAAKSPSPPG